MKSKNNRSGSGSASAHRHSDSGSGSTHSHSGRRHSRPLWRRIVVALHRDLGYFFAGIVIIYAVSGIILNHRDVINPNYTVEIIEGGLDDSFPYEVEAVDDGAVAILAENVGAEPADVIKHYPSNGYLKVLLKGGSSIVADLNGRTVTYEKVTRRVVIGNLVRLHCNPGGWWTTFSDIFAVCLALISLTGLFILKGRQGFLFRGLILLLLGLAAPILLLFA